MGQTIIQRGFAAGEFSPSLTARADLAKYIAGLRTCRNFIVMRSGGATNRSGTVYLATAKLAGASEAFLQPFRFAAADSSFAIECGDLYFRFFKNGVPVTVSGVAAWSGATNYVAGDVAVSGGVNYYCILAHLNHVPPNATYWYALTGTILEIPTPYPVGAFKPPAPACFTQQGVVITITHLNYAPRELRFASATRWTLTVITTGPSIAPPATPAGVAGAAGTRTYSYVVSAAKLETYEQSNPCATIVIPLAAAPTVDAPHALSWAAVPDTAEYYIYSDAASGNGTYGYLGTATGIPTFNDVGTTPDYNDSPPIPRALFAVANEYPAVSVVYQQRRLMAGTNNNREQVFASRTGFYSNFGIRSPLQDDDAVTFTIASDFIQPVHHLIGLTRLILLTDEGEWRIDGDDTGALIPTAINARQHGWVGASFVPPVVIGETVLFVQGRGSVMRDLRFDVNIDGISGRDLTLYSSHLFRRFTITDMDYAQNPDSVVWCVRSDGALLGLTYVKDEDVWGWHRHDTQGTFESVCVIPEGNQDAVYVVVKRTINGADTRYIERFATRSPATVADAVHVDAAVVYSGVPSTLITGLSHLRGAAVKVLADGVALPGPFVVTAGGTITLPTAASKASVGLGITAELETLDLDVVGTSIRDSKKRVQALSLLLEDSARGFLVGPDDTHLFAQTKEAWEPAGVVSGQVEINLTAGFTNHGRVLIRHTDPTPLTILGVLPHVDVGG